MSTYRILYTHDDAQSSGWFTDVTADDAASAAWQVATSVPPDQPVPRLVSVAELPAE